KTNFGTRRCAILRKSATVNGSAMVCLLPRWRRRGQPSTPCALVDGGVRRGGDILKALALGARAVLVGRPYWWGLAAGGARGVSGVIDVFRNELDMAMALSGSR